MAEDLAQEVLLVLHEKYAALDRIEDLLPLSLEIARFKIWARAEKSSAAARIRRSRWTICRWPARTPDPFEQAARRERVDRLEAALRGVGRPLPGIVSFEAGGLHVPGDSEAA